MKMRSLIFLFPLILSSPLTLAQEASEAGNSKKVKSRVFQDYGQTIALRKPVKYLAPEEARGRPALEFVFDIAETLPKGAKITFELEYAGGLSSEQTLFAVKGARRKNVTFRWTPKEKLVISTASSPFQYRLRVQINPEEQSVSVKKAMADLKEFPMRRAPWPWYFRDHQILIGTSEERAKLQEEVCTAYEKSVDKLIDSYKTIKKLVSAAEPSAEDAEGEEEEFDFEAFEADARKWRKKQGAIQREIFAINEKTPDIANAAPEAYGSLGDLGRIVSKWGMTSLGKVLKDRKLEKIKFEKRPKDEDLRSFSSIYRLPASVRVMNQKANEVLDLACPIPETTAPPVKKEKKSAKKKGKSKKKGKKRKTGNKKKKPAA